MLSVRQKPVIIQSFDEGSRGLAVSELVLSTKNPP